MQDKKKPFYIKNCSLSSIATGEKASSLIELRNKIALIDEGSLFYHFWSGHLHPQFIHTQHHNDFASWIFHRLHDGILGEQLSIVDPTAFSDLEALRQEILEIIDRRLDNYEFVIWTKKEEQFHFIRSLVIVFDTKIIMENPEDLPHILNLLPPSSIFYHFIDARGRTEEKIDDFSIWLKNFGDLYENLQIEIQAIDPYFLTLSELKEKLIETVKNSLNRIPSHG